VPWECPKCLTRITAEEYLKVLFPVEPYRCRFCGLALVVDKATDRLIAAPEKPPRSVPPRKK
jgi:rubredoxin